MRDFETVADDLIKWELDVFADSLRESGRERAEEGLIQLFQEAFFELGVITPHSIGIKDCIRRRFKGSVERWGEDYADKAGVSYSRLTQVIYRRMQEMRITMQCRNEFTQDTARGFVPTFSHIRGDGLALRGYLMLCGALAFVVVWLTW